MKWTDEEHWEPRRRLGDNQAIRDALYGSFPDVGPLRCQRVTARHPDEPQRCPNKARWMVKGQPTSAATCLSCLVGVIEEAARPGVQVTVWRL